MSAGSVREGVEAVTWRMFQTLVGAKQHPPSPAPSGSGDSPTSGSLGPNEPLLGRSLRSGWFPVGWLNGASAGHPAMGSMNEIDRSGSRCVCHGSHGPGQLALGNC